jgi:hypothetical protein
MNAIQLKNRVDFYLDMTRAARFTFAEYNIAVNDTIEKFVTETMGDPSHRTPENFQWVQQLRDDLYTLLKTAAPTLASGTSITTPYYTSGVSTYPNPADYYALVRLTLITSGKTIYARPTSENEIGPLLEDSFRHPSDVKVYYTEDSTGVRIYRGTTAPTSASLTYIKTPATFSCGAETQLIDGGPAVTLTNAATYYATEVSVYNGVTYQIGATITGVAGLVYLTSGQVILVSNTTPCDLPDRTHEEIAKRAAATMLLTTANYPAAQAVNSIEGQP